MRPSLRPVCVVAGAVSLFVLAVPRTSSAFCRTTTVAVPANYNPGAQGCFTDGLPLFWKNACVGYSINSAASTQTPLSEATRVIDAAFATWNSVTCTATGATVGIGAANFGDVTCGQIQYNKNGPNQNVIVFRDNGWPYSDPNNTLGLTTVTFNAENGEIYDADMELNATGNNLSTADLVPANGFDLLSVVTHEAGHFLGIAHATDSRATMYASYRPGSSAQRTLTQDDQNALCAIYPSTTQRAVAASVNATGFVAADACDPAPRHGFSETCEANPAPADSTTSGCATSPAPLHSLGRESGVLAIVTAALAFLGLRRAGARRIGSDPSDRRRASS